MAQPRTTLVSLDATPWYHVVSRCVRRAYLCGFEHHSGRNFEHRRGWIVARMEQLANYGTASAPGRSRQKIGGATPLPGKV